MKHRINSYAKRRISACWAQLPLPALAEVVKYLSDTERVACAQVCQQWKTAFESPMLWRERKFEFGGSRFRPQGYRAVLFAKKMGRHLRHVTIVCRQLTSHTCETMVMYLEAFLESLTSSRAPFLEMLEIEGLELEFWRYGTLRGQIADCLTRFLKTQNNLKSVSMPNAQFALVPGTDVLSAIAEGNGSKLETLLMEFSVRQRQSVQQTNQFTAVMECFTNLRRVDLNYCCITDSIVKTWSTTLKGKLVFLRLRCNNTEPHGHVITNRAWSLLTSSCPLLLVEISIVGFGNAEEVMPILANPMPLKTLTFCTGFDNGSELRLNSILNHVASCFHQSLVTLNLEFDNFHDNVNDALVYIISRCRNLTSLRIKAIINQEVAQFVCRMIAEGRTVLTHVDIMMCDVTPMEMEQIRDLSDDMVHVAPDHGVFLLLRDDLYS